MGLFNDLFSHGHSYTKVGEEKLPAKQIASACVVTRSKDGKSWNNVIFTLKDGGKRECKISKESEFADAESGEELPVSGTIFQLEDENGNVTKSIYWEEA